MQEENLSPLEEKKSSTSADVKPQRLGIFGWRKYIVCMCACACECLCECTQEQCTYVDRCREYTNHCKRVRKAMREDKRSG